MAETMTLDTLLAAPGGVGVHDSIFAAGKARAIEEMERAKETPATVAQLVEMGLTKKQAEAIRAHGLTASAVRIVKITLETPVEAAAGKKK